ncbi:MAG: FecR domain-containing protein [Luteolibacter sp.]
MKTPIYIAAWLICGGLKVSAGLPLTESTFTEIIQEANVVAASSKAVTRARTNTLFKSPDLVRTGQISRVELTAKDQTITRVGANTTFTFAPTGRDIQLKQGSVLFHSPAGAGGGAIKNRGSSAAVLGTTLIGAVLPDGRFKVLDLEGSVKVTILNGDTVTLKPGQMVIVSADGNKIGDVMDFKLGDLAARLQLVVGFSKPVPSWSLIEAAIQAQNEQIASGTLTQLFPFQESGFGLDIRYRGLNDLPFYSFNGLGNPLDFPGSGGVGPTPGGPGGYQLLPPWFNQANGFVIINPPPATDVNPPAASGSVKSP